MDCFIHLLYLDDCILCMVCMMLVTDVVYCAWSQVSTVSVTVLSTIYAAQMRQPLESRSQLQADGIKPRASDTTAQGFNR